MTQKFHIGDEVKWKWSTGWGHGKIVERFTERVTRKIGGSEITRNATSDEPAYLIHQEDGDRVLKSESEISKD